MYGADFATAGTLYGKILRSPHAHARIRSIDTSKAASLPGVKAVVTAADIPDQKFEYVGPERVAQNFWHMTRNVMAREKALYEGHAVAAIAAISRSVRPLRRPRFCNARRPSRNPMPAPVVVKVSGNRGAPAWREAEPAL